MMDPAEHDRRRCPGVGLFMGVAANLIAIASGGVFFLSPIGASFRGMEPEAQWFIVGTLFAAAMGAGAIVGSLYDMFAGRRWLSGLCGLLLAPLPFFVANGVSEIAAYMLRLSLD